MHENITKSAVGYIRVSTGQQAIDGVSLQSQRDKIAAWCNLNDYTLINIYEDSGLSGKRADNRPGLQAAMSDACEHGYAFVVYSISRMARSIYDTVEISDMLGKSNADLVSLSENIDTTTATGKMVFRLLAVLAEFERDQISERTKTGLQWKKENGEKTGGYLPVGFKSKQVQKHGKTVKILVPDGSNIRETVTKLKFEGKSYRQISKALANVGILNREGKPFGPSTIKSILQQG